MHKFRRSLNLEFFGRPFKLSPTSVEAPPLLAFSRPTLDNTDVEKLQSMLRETVVERKEADIQIRALHARIEEMNTELRFQKTGRQALFELEVWLLRRLDELTTPAAPVESQLMDLSEFLSGDPPGTPRPAASSLPSMSSPGPNDCKDAEVAAAAAEDEAAASAPSKPLSLANVVSFVSSWKKPPDEPIVTGTDTATCQVCGQKFPLDAELIEEHAKGCTGELDQTNASGVGSSSFEVASAY
eukprot:TRINITY_DN65480_c0_g1_i1.p1 TRINITY_DN65480_c0_g1~~TRINITY_DN65480_c0_g1_i1.p1  ORF type:complete len:242 (-),score=48.98 TRINITY_DN65480_c0_g1_i1:103-828(-)